MQSGNFFYIGISISCIGMSVGVTSNTICKYIDIGSVNKIDPFVNKLLYKTILLKWLMWL